jgi:nucleoside-diphosphate-sugar epimerase
MMRPAERTVAITGSHGYLGGVIRRSFAASGWRSISLVRSPVQRDGEARRFDLARPCDDRLFTDVDVLIHCAYDMSLTGRSEIMLVNVEGTRRLLRAAGVAGVPRVIVLSSMSAYEGTTQIYGQAKLAIEAAALQVGGCVLRPGLVYGDPPGGMVAALRRLVRLPFVPIPIGQMRQFTVHEDDFIAVVTAVAEAPAVPPRPVGVASPNGIEFRDLLSTFAAWERRTCHFVPIPWQPMYWALRLAEHLPVTLPFRADSLLGLVHPARSVPGGPELQALGVHLREFDVVAPADR